MAYQTKNPYTERVVQTFAEHDKSQLETILSTSSRTFLADWRHRSFDQRASVVRKAAALLRERVEEFAHLATLEMGKLVGEAKGEVMLCATILDYYADKAPSILARKEIEVDVGEAYVDSAPIGTIFCIEPWNFPYYQLARVAAPNLMAGNTLIVKHAPNVPQCALAFERLFLDAGAPVGAYMNVFISNDQAATVIADVRIKGVALTGSERAGSAVAAEAGKALKKSTMELGGSDAFIVLDDADIEVAVKLAVEGRMSNAGQVCDSPKRFIVDEKVADVFVAKFQSEIEKLVTGNPADAATTLAPLNSEAALELALAQIQQAVADGATVICGGKRVSRTGYFLEPTLITGVVPGNAAYYREFFAPVGMIFRVADEKAAIALANDSPFGLGGSVITGDLERGKRVAAQMETGMVFINQPAVSGPEFPFGGVKNSGYGRELSDLGIGEFINKKLVRAA